MAEIITSAQNPKIKNLKKLEKAAERREQHLFLIEGLREIVLAYRAGYSLVNVFICRELLKEQPEYALPELPLDIEIARQEAFGIESRAAPVESYYVTRAVYETLAYRETTEGIIATARPKNLSTEQLVLPPNALLLVIEGIEKPGNLGGMLRTCDAAGVDAVIICNAKTDVYNANVIRASIGTVFTNQVAVCTTEECIAYLQRNKIKSYAAELTAEKFHFQQNFKGSTAIAVGTEATGLSSGWLHAADEKIKIPMLGKIDSMNVSVSAGILLYEARRQRMVLS